LLRKKANYLDLRCVGGECNSGKRRIFDLDSLDLEVNAKGVDNLLDIFLGGCAWEDVL